MKIDTSHNIKHTKHKRSKKSKQPLIQKNVDILTVIIPTMCLPPQNWFNYLLSEIQKSDYVKEIIIINNSTDDMLKKYELPDKSRVFQMEENIGCNPAWNLGMDNCSTELYLIINDDILCSKQVINECCDTIKEHEEIGILTVDSQKSRTISPEEYSSWKFNSPRTLQDNAFCGFFMMGRTDSWYPIHPTMRILLGDDFLKMYYTIVKKKKLVSLSSMKIIHWHKMTQKTVGRNRMEEWNTWLNIVSQINSNNFPSFCDISIEKVNTMDNIKITKMLYGVDDRYIELDKKFYTQKSIYVNNSYFGTDPVPNIVKHLKIECEYKNEQYYIRYKEGEFFRLEDIVKQIQDSNYLSLGQIFNNYGSDKSSVHGYDIPYSNFLAHRRSEKLKFLEIGVILSVSITKDNGSLKAWERYLPNAELFGIDINPKCLEYNSSRIKTAVADYRNKDQMIKIINDFGGEFDVIIDDADHVISGQKMCFSILWPFVKVGGFYAIEDIYQKQSDPDWAGEIAKHIICSPPYSEMSLHVYPHMILMVKENKKP